jgi:hypothetical protein
MEIKTYIVVNSGTLTPTEPQWVSFFQQAKTKALAAAIITAARASQNFISAEKRSKNASALLKNAMIVFEIDDAFVADIVVVVNAQATIRSVTGTVQQKFVGVLLSELREAGRDMGLTTPQSNQITMSVVGYGDRMTAITAVQAYLSANAGIWYA